MSNQKLDQIKKELKEIDEESKSDEIRFAQLDQELDEIRIRREVRLRKLALLKNQLNEQIEQSKRLQDNLMRKGASGRWTK